MPTPLPSTVLEWSRGLVSLSPGVVPCRGLRPDEWHDTHGRLCAFVDQWGVQAHEAGWDTLRLFGVGPNTGALRGDFGGILIFVSVDIHKVTPEWIKLGRWTAYRHEPVKMPGMVPVWETGGTLTEDMPSGRLQEGALEQGRLGVFQFFSCRSEAPRSGYLRGRSAPVCR